MNQDKNDVPLDQAPAKVNDQPVVSVVQVTISDNPAEDGYKVLLANSETAVVPMNEFVAGAEVSSQPIPQVEEAPAAPVASVEPPAAQPFPQPEAPAVPAMQYQPTVNDQPGVTQ